MRNYSDTLRTSPDNIRQYQTPTDTNKHQQTPANVIQPQHEPSHILKQPHGVSGDVLGRLLVSVCHFCCPELSVDVWNRCLGAFKVKCMYVCWVWMHQMVYLSVQALNGAANALYWNISERLNCIHLTLLKHQNTKTALSKLSKNHWGFAFFKKFGSVRKKLPFTVFLDHPVLYDVGLVSMAPSGSTLAFA